MTFKDGDKITYPVAGSSQRKKGTVIQASGGAPRIQPAEGGAIVLVPIGDLAHDSSPGDLETLFVEMVTRSKLPRSKEDEAFFERLRKDTGQPGANVEEMFARWRQLAGIK